MPPGDARFHRPLNIFFDVDDTLLTWYYPGPLHGSILRPHVHDVFQQLKDDGHEIYIWSGVGLRHYELKEHGLLHFVTDVYVKPLEDFQESLRKYTPIDPDFVIDDYPEIVEALGGHMIRTLSFPQDNDHEMWRAYDAIAAYVRRLTADDASSAAGS